MWNFSKFFKLSWYENLNKWMTKLSLAADTPAHKSKASKFPVLKASGSICETEKIHQDKGCKIEIPIEVIYTQKNCLTIRFYGYNMWHDNWFRQSIMLYREESEKKKERKKRRPTQRRYLWQDRKRKLQTSLNIGGGRRARWPCLGWLVN